MIAASAAYAQAQNAFSAYPGGCCPTACPTAQAQTCCQACPAAPTCKTVPSKMATLNGEAAGCNKTKFTWAVPASCSPIV